jgi:hypothetical protein
VIRQAIDAGANDLHSIKPPTAEKSEYLVTIQSQSEGEGKGRLEGQKKKSPP